MPNLHIACDFVFDVTRSLLIMQWTRCEYARTTRTRRWDGHLVFLLFLSIFLPLFYILTYLSLFFFLYIFLRFSVQESNKKKLSFISRKFERFLFLYFRFCSPCFSSFLSFYFLHYLFINRVINEIGFNIKLCSKVRIFLYKF